MQQTYQLRNEHQQTINQPKLSLATATVLVTDGGSEDYGQGAAVTRDSASCIATQEQVPEGPLTAINQNFCL